MTILSSSGSCVRIEYLDNNSTFRNLLGVLISIAFLQSVQKSIQLNCPQIKPSFLIPKHINEPSRYHFAELQKQAP